MISPKCFICHATFKHKRTFHLLEFKKEKEQETFLPDKVGYTPNFVWFCNCHFKYGEKYCEYAFTNVRQQILNYWNDDNHKLDKSPIPNIGPVCL